MIGHGMAAFDIEKGAGLEGIWATMKKEVVARRMRPYRTFEIRDWSL